MVQHRTQDLREVLVSFQSRVWRFAYGLTKNPHDADDLMQATYARAFERLHQWQPGSRADSWLYRIAHSIFLNQIDAQKVRARYASDQDTESVPSAAGSEPDAELSFQQVRRHIYSLPVDQRSVILLVTVEGLSYQEAATALNIPVGTVTSRLARGRMALMKKLMPEHERRPKLVKHSDEC